MHVSFVFIEYCRFVVFLYYLSQAINSINNGNDDIVENSNLLKLAVQDKHDSHDVILLTKMDISIPMKAPEMKHAVKNIVAN